MTRHSAHIKQMDETRSQSLRTYNSSTSLFGPMGRLTQPRRHTHYTIETTLSQSKRLLVFGMLLSLRIASHSKQDWPLPETAAPRQGRDPGSIKVSQTAQTKDFSRAWLAHSPRPGPPMEVSRRLERMARRIVQQ